VSKSKKPPPEQIPLFDAPAAAPAVDNPRMPDYRPSIPSPRTGPTVDEYDVQQAPLAQKHSRTSVEAANLMSGSRAGSLRATIYRWLLEQPTGATDEEGQDALGMDGNTYRPRRLELQEAGLVGVTGRERLTKSRRHAVVYRAMRPEGE
jgi:hypothetical protein